MPPVSRRNVVLIAVDTLRADHLGCYGYGLNTSPNIDELASQSIIFDNAYAAGIPTTPSFTALFSGRHPVDTGVLNHPAQALLSLHTPLLPERFKRAGFTTLACDNLVVTGGGRASWFARGFDYYSGFRFDPRPGQSRAIVDSAIHLLSAQGDAPFFLFVHFWDPHSPYMCEARFSSQHVQPLRSSRKGYERVRAQNSDYYDPFLEEMGLAKEDSDLSTVMARYDGCISQVDEQVGRLLSVLSQRPDWDETVVVLVSDHGEAFGEGGIYFDHAGLYDAVSKIAFILRDAEVDHVRERRLVSNESIASLILDHCGLSSRREWGGSRQEGGGTDAGVGYVVSVEATRQASISVTDGLSRLIVPICQNSSGKPVHDVYGRVRATEPVLLSDRPEQRQETERRLRQVLDDWLSVRGFQGATQAFGDFELSLPHAAHLRRLDERRRRT